VSCKDLPRLCVDNDDDDDDDDDDVTFSDNI
jgi:hypothetical protein